jgi:threonine/homoserine/homoserine lactone efflux protein
MRNKLSVGGYIIAALIIIGLIASLRAYFIPICVFGIIFLLYKFPPSRWRAKKSSNPVRKQGKRKTQDATFRVIQGNKNSDSDDRPKYH